MKNCSFPEAKARKTRHRQSIHKTKSKSGHTLWQTCYYKLKTKQIRMRNLIREECPQDIDFRHEK